MHPTRNGYLFEYFMRIKRIAGIGGIGSGVVYLLDGNNDLGRNETRPGTKLPHRDFCKLHIISHYLTVILHSAFPDVKVFPIGAVGNDREGDDLLGLFREYGLSTDFVTVSQEFPTLFSICYQFPDGSGGNITESRSASSTVDAAGVTEAIRNFADEEDTLLFAVPEVPLETRLSLLKAGKRGGPIKAASFLSNEIAAALSEEDSAGKIDMLSINMDEARAFLGYPEDLENEKIVENCVSRIIRLNPQIKLAVTDGKKGAYGYYRGETVFFPGLKTESRNSAGAGDAFLAGLIIGKVLGLPFLKGETLTSCETALCLSALSVESSDTINFSITGDRLRAFIRGRLSKVLPGPGT